ncbi:hypothetical protein K474DRAFT_1707280 [Panus rudis PR-1116 ss-1]|nr:hypothetical protein K474DRAFT_1707280 [Panus rudis PR-1116 ss-1]
MASNATAVPELPPIPPIIAQLTGPLFLGHLFNWGLFGALTVQTYVYYLAFPNDRVVPKTLVAFVYVLEVLQTVLATKDAFRNFGTGWGNMVDLDAVGLLWFSVPFLGSIISSTAQLFYAWRIWILSKKIWISVLIVALSLTQLVAGLYTGVIAHIIGEFSEGEFERLSVRNTIVWLGGTALCDVILAGSMIYFLNRANTGFRQTATLITKFIRVTVETGLVCATFAILDLSLFLAFQSNNYHLAPSIALSKLYSNSLLVVLNVRVQIVGGRNESMMSAQSAYTSSTQVSSRQLRHGVPNGTGLSTKDIVVNVSQSKMTDIDTRYSDVGNIPMVNFEQSHMRDESLENVKQEHLV